METGKERISPELTKRMEGLISTLFMLNRIMDRGLSICEVRWKLINFESKFHQIVAHAPPILSDRLTGYMAKRNVEVLYPDTTGGLRDYASPMEFFEFVLENFNRFEDEIEDTIDYAASVDKDNATKQFLQSFLATWVDYVATMNNIVDLAEQFAPNSESLGLQIFDDEFEKAFVVSDITPDRISVGD